MMEDEEEETLDERPFHLLRVVQFKAVPEQRGFVKSSHRTTLIKRLRGSLTPKICAGGRAKLPFPHLKYYCTITQVVPAPGQNSWGDRQEGAGLDEGGGACMPKPLPRPPARPASFGAGGRGATSTFGEGKGKGGEALFPQRAGGAPWRRALLPPIYNSLRVAPRYFKTRQHPSPIVHLCNLVRPFTLGQLKELLGRTGQLKDDGFWIDPIKSHCFVTYCAVEDAVATRQALHGVKWPECNPKVLMVHFAEQEELDFYRGLPVLPPCSTSSAPQGMEPWQWAEWEGKPPEEPPTKLLDDLFRKTKAVPCIYWLPLTESQVLEKQAERAARARAREQRWKEQEEQKLKQRQGGGAEEGGASSGPASLHAWEGDGAGPSAPLAGSRKRWSYRPWRR